MLPSYAGTPGLDKDAIKPGTLAVLASYSKANEIFRSADLATNTISQPSRLKSSLSPLDHLAYRLYFPKLLYFSVPDDDFATVTDVFQNGLAKTLQALPIYSGTLALDKDASKPGTLAIVAPYLEAGQILRNADLRDTYDFAALEAKEFPPDGIDLKLVWPEAPNNSAPVLLAQVSLVKGGAILYVGIP